MNNGTNELKFSDRLESTVGKSGNADYQHFLFQRMFSKAFCNRVSKIQDY